MFFYPKASNFHNSGMIGRRKLSDASVNNIFNILSIGLQYTLTDTDRNCNSLFKLVDGN